MTALFLILLLVLAVVMVAATWHMVGSDGYGFATDGPRVWESRQASTLPFESYVRAHV